MRQVALLMVLIATGCAVPVATTTPPATAPDPAKAAIVVPPPVPMFPPADWTHKELAEFLTKKGVPGVELVALAGVDAIGVPGISATLFHSGFDDRSHIVAVLCKDEKEARERAGSLGEGAFHKGRFALGFLSGKPAEKDKMLMPQIRAALGVP